MKQTAVASVRMVMLVLVAFVVLSAMVDGAEIGMRPAKRGTYRIHGLMTYPEELFRKKFSATFDEYLNAEVAPLFSHGGEHIRFEMGGQDFGTIFDSAEMEDFDFIFTFPNMAGCLEAEFGASPLLTMRDLRRGIELNRYGGVIFTRADRDDISSVHDLKDKNVYAVELLLIQHQWMIFQENGMDMMNDVGQVSAPTSPCMPAFPPSPCTQFISAWIHLILVSAVALHRK